MPPTTPLCIEEGFQACKHRKRPCGRPIDIMGAVSYVDRPSERLTILHIVDQSGKARLYYYGAQKQRRIVETFGVSHGGTSKSRTDFIVDSPALQDIIRFNRLALRGPREHSHGAAFKYEFHHPVHEKEDGEDFCRLARMRAPGAVSYEILPPPMAFDTDTRRIQELGKWFSDSTFSRIPEMACQKQQISSIQPGLTLHIDANVDSVVMAENVHFFASKAKRTKRRQPGCYAILSDSTGVVSLLLELHHYDMISIVKAAHQNHCSIRITHVRAIHHRDPDESILLVPTYSSRMQLIDWHRHFDICCSPDEVTHPTPQQDGGLDDTISTRETDEVVCSIREIVVEGIPLTRHKHIYLNSGNVDNLHELLCQDDFCYRNVTLELAEAPFGRLLIANAEGNTVQKLLGDISPNAWKTSSQVQATVHSLLCGYLEEAVELVWLLTLQRKATFRTVVDVHIVNLRK